MVLIKLGTGAKLQNTFRRYGLHIQEPLYHATSLRTCPLILEQGFRSKVAGGANDAYYDNALCFTRAFSYTLKDVFGSSEVVFVVDKKELKSRYKIYPYNWYYSIRIKNLFNYDDIYDYLMQNSFSLNSETEKLLEDLVSESKHQLNREWLHKHSFKSIFRNIIRDRCLEDEEGVRYTDRYCGESYDILRRGLESYFKNYEKNYSHTENKPFNEHWEYEDRVSITARGSDSERETVIPRRYIKAILIKRPNILKRYVSSIYDNYRDIPVFYYNPTINFYDLLTPESLEKVKGLLNLSQAENEEILS